MPASVDDAERFLRCLLGLPDQELPCQRLSLRVVVVGEKPGRRDGQSAVLVQRVGIGDGHGRCVVRNGKRHRRHAALKLAVGGVVGERV